MAFLAKNDYDTHMFKELFNLISPKKKETVPFDTLSTNDIIEEIANKNDEITKLSDFSDTTFSFNKNVLKVFAELRNRKKASKHNDFFLEQNKDGDTRFMIFMRIAPEQAIDLFLNQKTDIPANRIASIRNQVQDNFLTILANEAPVIASQNYNVLGLTGIHPQHFKISGNEHQSFKDIVSERTMSTQKYKKRQVELEEVWAKFDENGASPEKRAPVVYQKDLEKLWEAFDKNGQKTEAYDTALRKKSR